LQKPAGHPEHEDPGIIETTEAKPAAAKGMCQRRDTGVMTTPTAKHATNARNQMHRSARRP
jgi:hypothetical protein